MFVSIGFTSFNLEVLLISNKNLIFICREIERKKISGRILDVSKENLIR